MGWNFVKSRPEFAIEFLGGDLRIDAGDLVGSCLGTLRDNVRTPFTFEEGLKIDLQTLAPRCGRKHVRDPDVFGGGFGGDAEGPLRCSDARRRRQREGNRELDYDCAHNHSENLVAFIQTH